MKSVAYLRVSTAQQDAGSQRLAILEYAHREGFRIDDFIEATASTRTNAKRRRLDQLMPCLSPATGSWSANCPASGARWARSSPSSMRRQDLGGLRRHQGTHPLRGPSGHPAKVMTTLFALFADVERDLISERTREGLARARASGKKLGRPKGTLGVSRLASRRRHDCRPKRSLSAWRGREITVTAPSNCTLISKRLLPRTPPAPRPRCRTTVHLWPC